MMIFLILFFSVPLSAEAVTVTAPVTVTVTELYNDTTPTLTTVPTTTVTPTCCMTTSPSTPPPNPVTQAPPSPSQTMCHGGWEVFQGRCYYFENEGMTWPQAQVNTEQDCSTTHTLCRKLKVNDLIIGFSAFISFMADTVHI